MTALAIALAVVAVLAAIGVIVLVFKYSAVRKTADDATRELQGLREKLDQVSAAAASEIAKRENVIKFVKDQLKQAEEAIYASQDPIVIRDHLKRVLALPAPKAGDPPK